MSKTSAELQMSWAASAPESEAAMCTAGMCVVMQDFVIARQEEEMSSLKVQIGGLQQQLAVAADRAIALTLKSSGWCLLPGVHTGT